MSSVKPTFLIKLILYCSILSFFSVTARAYDVILKNGVQVNGQFKRFHKHKLYLEKGDVLLVLHEEILEVVKQEDLVVSIDELTRMTTQNINFNAYDEILDISNRTLNKYAIWQKVQTLYPELNPVRPADTPAAELCPGDIVITQTNYIATKPTRFFANWYDITFGHRFLERSAELRVSVSNVNNLPVSAPLLPFIFEADVDIRTVTVSLRKFFKETPRGFYLGGGFTSASFKTKNISVAILAWPLGDSEGNSSANIFGPLLEFGYSGFLGQKLYSGLNLGLSYVVTSEKRYDGRMRSDAVVLPMLSYTLGFVF